MLPALDTACPVHLDDLDQTVFRTVMDWRRDGRSVMLATVVRTWGSSPRPVGSVMALCAGGERIGSVSGGCIEDDLAQGFEALASSAEGLARKTPMVPRQIEYGISADQAHRFGLPCGGSVRLLLEYDPDFSALEKLVLGLAQGRLMQRQVRLLDGMVSIQAATSTATLNLDGESMSCVFGPSHRMLLIGGGQLTEYLATMANFCGFAVTVCDPRDEQLVSWPLPGITLTREMPDDAVLAFKPDCASCVIALTHDPKLDDLALMEALKTDALYVGALGSRRNNAARRDRLHEHFGLSLEELSRLRGPVGLYIGSKRPPEIAVSVMAEVLAVRNRVALTANMHVAEAKNILERDALGEVPADVFD